MDEGLEKVEMSRLMRALALRRWSGVPEQERQTHMRRVRAAPRNVRRRRKDRRTTLTRINSKLSKLDKAMSLILVYLTRPTDSVNVHNLED
jgi:hypothetical protein